jgi:hypothetical protein
MATIATKVPRVIILLKALNITEFDGVKKPCVSIFLRESVGSLENNSLRGFIATPFVKIFIYELIIS